MSLQLLAAECRQKYVQFKEQHPQAGKLVKEVMSVALATIPAYQVLVRKTQLQRGERPTTIKRLNIRSMGCMSLLSGFTTAMQIVLKERFQLMLESQSKVVRLSDFWVSTLSCAASATVSSPFMAVLSGILNEMTLKESLRSLSIRSVTCFAGREVAFLGAISASEPVHKSLTTYLGDNPATQTLAHLLTGFVGGVISNPFDLAVVRMQRKLTIWDSTQPLTKNLKTLTYGSLYRGLGIGVLLVAYGEYNKRL